MRYRCHSWRTRGTLGVMRVPPRMTGARPSRIARGLAILAAVASLSAPAASQAEAGECQRDPSATSCCGGESCCGCCEQSEVLADPITRHEFRDADEDHCEATLSPPRCTCAFDRVPEATHVRPTSQADRLSQRVLWLSNPDVPVILPGGAGAARNSVERACFSITAAERCHWFSRLVL